MQCKSGSLIIREGKISMRLYKFGEKFRYDKHKYHIVINYFENMIKNDFLSKIEHMGREMSYGSDISGITFPNIFEDPEEEGYFEEGVMFYLDTEEIIIDYKMFIECIELATQIYLEQKNDIEEKQIIEINIQTIKTRYNMK